MADFRIKYGLAFGPFGTVGSTSGGGTAPNLLPPQDATPDISLGTYFLTGNTSALEITDFEGKQAGGQNGVEEGKLLLINFRDNNTTIANAGNITLAESGGAFQSGDTLLLLHHNSAWQEVSRSHNSQSAQTSFSLAGSASFNVDGVKIGAILSTAATTVLTSMSGGYEGQRVTLFLNTAGVATRIANTAGNIYVQGTAWTTMVNLQAMDFIKSGSRWLFVGDIR